MARSLKDHAVISLKGMAMGAADVVPGVSGGTIAFISGIYEELLDSINSVNLESLFTLFKKGPVAFWKAINGNFLFALFLGIGISILSLAKFITWMLDENPIIIWSFFFGLVLASIFYVGREIKKWSPGVILMFILGTVIAWYITTLNRDTGDVNNAYLFICGAVAICAMILPGISGSFILVLMGAYPIVLDAIHNLNLVVLVFFGAGCVAGLLSFSRVLSLLLKKAHDITVGLLAGFMLGSLNKVWPWKETLSYYSNSKGEQIPFLQKNILPNNSSWMEGLLFAIIGFALIFVIEYAAKRMKKSV